MKKYIVAFGRSLLDALGEIVVGFIAFGIGAVIVTLFGMNWDSPIDSELIVLIGIAVPIVITIIAIILVKFFKKKFVEKPKQTEEKL